MWRNRVTRAGLEEMWAEWGAHPLDEPVLLVVDFHLPRPARPRFRDDAATKPDLDKLTRAIGDALCPRTVEEAVLEGLRAGTALA